MPKAPPSAKTPPSCFICHRLTKEVELLIDTGADSHLCNRCIEVAGNVIAKARRPKMKVVGKDKPVPKPREISAHLDEYVIGQERAKLVTSVAVYNHYKRREMALRVADGAPPPEVQVEKDNLLLMGPTGTGKTQIARTIARTLDVPLYVGDATKLTSAGYAGDDVESLLQGLLMAADGDLERAQWGIIFLDEVDKLRKSGGRGLPGYKDVGGEAVQQALLKILEGGKVQVHEELGAKGGPCIQFDTTNVLFVCAGSFAGIEEVVTTRMNKKGSLGFGAVERSKIDVQDAHEHVTHEDLLEYGIIPEFLGRLPSITATRKLTEEEMLRILTEPKDAVVRQKQALFAMDGVKLTFDVSALRVIAKKAMAHPTGARSLKGIVWDLLLKHNYELPSRPEVQAMVVTEAMAEGTGEPTLYMAEGLLVGG